MYGPAPRRARSALPERDEELAGTARGTPLSEWYTEVYRLSGNVLVDRAFDRRTYRLAKHQHREPDVHMNLDAVVGDEDATRHALAMDAHVVALPLGGQPQAAAQLVGDLVDASPGFLDAQGMLAFNFQWLARVAVREPLLRRAIRQRH